MAKNIKVIQCPKCGSTEKTEVKPDFFRCNNCNTEYYLDNDDVNINHNYNQAQNIPAPFNTSNTPKKVIYAILISLIIFLFFVIKLATCNSSPRSTNSSTLGEVRWNRSEKLAFVSGAGKPMILIVGKKSFYGSANKENKDKFFAEVYDVATEKILKSTELQGISDASSNDFQVRSFINGDIYFIMNKTKVFKFDRTNYSVSDQTVNLFKNAPQFSAGIASIEFVYDNYGDGFNTITNDGNNLFYYPQVDKVYTKDEAYDAGHDMITLLPGAQEKTAFTFSRVGREVKNDKTHLVKYIYKTYVGGPKDDATFEWRNNYGGKYTSAENNKVVFLTSFAKESGRVISYTIMRPERLFFKPKILYFDNEVLLISFNTTAAEKPPTSIQCLNANTGAIIFTTPLSENKYLKDGIRYKDGFVVSSYNEFYNLDSKGKLIKQLKLN
ncbi:hypothetical protein EZJ43_04105 [Pedobacter changchengzhani]|uniref:Uncharacterized protein n=1 Tax=Pedobacter changchengzhani TaxID=2529274 RepID=A0A4R5MNQ0_9SPHI|nr:hypothetical protein [Pedobacter changchengzhani]TDG37308.1 hypothetical protein EZJ43_04105 [Pedobacter changchengzhani]